MEPITGKANSILKRLPHFCDPDEAGWLLLRFVDLFGRRLERTEAETYGVLRAHHVETADNEGSRGYIAPPDRRGDLDKIFALYLEALGGTSQLVQVTPRFTSRSLNARRLAATLVQETHPLLPFLRNRVPQSTWDLLTRYQGEYALFRPDEIQPGFALSLLLRTPPISAYLAGRLARDAVEIHRLLLAYGGGSALDPRLREGLARFLNQTALRDASLFRANDAHFRNLLRSESDSARAASIWERLHGIYADLLRQRYLEERGPNQQQLLEALAAAEPASVPPGDDLVRLNRMLLEAAFAYSERERPWGFRPRAIPSLEEVRSCLVDVLNRLLDAMDLYDPSRFPELAEDDPTRARFANDPIWLNRLLLESAFPIEIEKSYVPYRERLRSLIQVLRRGASTRDGIVAIVAANLGIVGDDPQARAARARIEITEYNPTQTFFCQKLPLTFFAEFDVNNPNPEPVSPEIWITLPERLERTLANIRLVDVHAPDRFIRYSGRIRARDRLEFKGQSAKLNSLELTEGVEGRTPDVEPGRARWRFEADVVAEDDTIRPAGHFHTAEGRFDARTFAFDKAAFAFDTTAASVEVVSYESHPGTFTVTIPWHIPGFTDKFVESDDHPRHQILALVNRVKAAGVRASVAYRQYFPREEHGHSDQLELQVAGRLLQEDEGAEDAFAIDSRQSGRDIHDASDTLSLEARWDYTRFDSLNRLA